MTRRANGEGSIYQRADGRWAAIIELGSRHDGRRARKSFYGPTRREVHLRLTEALRGRMHGEPVASDRLMLGTFLEQWLEAARPSLRPRTWARYEQYVRLHVVPTLGRMPITKLQPRHLQQLYADRARAGSAPMTVRHLHAMLHRALAQAARWGHCVRNVAGLVDAPRAPHREMVALAPEQARALLEVAAGDRLEALYVLAVTTGDAPGRTPRPTLVRRRPRRTRARCACFISADRRRALLRGAEDGQLAPTYHADRARASRASSSSVSADRGAPRGWSRVDR